MKNTLLQLFPAALVIALYFLLAGADQISGLQAANRRLRELGSVEDHDFQIVQLQGEKRRVQAELDELRAAPAPASAVRTARTASAALNEAHRRISAHPGARILGVFRSGDAAGGGSGAQGSSEAEALLRQLGGDDVRRWSVSLEAPWPSARAILSDFAVSADGAPVVVQSLSMQPGIGHGKPTCWSMAICQ